MKERNNKGRVLKLETVNSRPFVFRTDIEIIKYVLSINHKEDLAVEK